MAKMMTKSQIAGHIADKFEITKKQSVEILEELATLAAKQARNGFVFPGVGKLVVVKRKARMGRNPQTGEAIKIPAKTVLKFRIAKAMKDPGVVVRLKEVGTEAVGSTPQELDKFNRDQFTLYRGIVADPRLKLNLQ